MTYNASAEQKIYNLIEEASKESLSKGCVILKQALTVLNQEFGMAHPKDLPKHDPERFKIRKKAYETIIDTYGKLIDKFISADYEALSDEKKRLESELFKSEKVEKGFQAYLGVIEKENGDLKETVGKLEKTIEKLDYEIAQLEESQQNIKNV